MTTYNKSTLKTFFETGDVPGGSNYADLIDSQINIVETAIQTMAGALATTELVASRVSATNANFTGTVSAATFNLTTVAATTVNATTVNAGAVSASTANITTISANSAYTNTIITSALTVTGGLISSTGIVSAAGITQGTAAVLTNVINRGKGVADGVTTGFTPLANRAGLVQYLYNEGVSANLWPPTGGTINGLAANAAFSLAASSSYTIFHITASAYGVK